MNQRFGVNEKVKAQIRNLKKKVVGMLTKVDVEDQGVRRAMCKAVLRIQFKSQERTSEQI